MSLETRLLALINAIGADIAALQAAGPGGSGASWVETEIDFGNDPQWEMTFPIVKAGISSGSKIAVVSSGKTATGRVGNDSEWDTLVLTATPKTGSFDITAVAVPGPVVGKRVVQYQISS